MAPETKLDLRWCVRHWGIIFLGQLLPCTLGQTVDSVIVQQPCVTSAVINEHHFVIAWAWGLGAEKRSVYCRCQESRMGRWQKRRFSLWPWSPRKAFNHGEGLAYLYSCEASLGRPGDDLWGQMRDNPMTQRKTCPWFPCREIYHKPSLFLLLVQGCF